MSQSIPDVEYPPHSPIRKKAQGAGLQRRNEAMQNAFSWPGDSDLMKG